VGFAVFPADGGTADEMMLAADAALYEVKQNGRDGYAPRTPAAH
jgi:GGDEF domain-containing protein